MSKELAYNGFILPFVGILVPFLNNVVWLEAHCNGVSVSIDLVFTVSTSNLSPVLVLCTAARWTA
jgi:hypothetical protein